MQSPLIPSQEPSANLHLLHLEDSELDHALVCNALHKQALPFTITRTQSLPQFSQWVAENRFDIILADYRLPGFTALQAWQAIQHTPDVPPFILLSGAIGEAAAVAAIHQGISDYLHKDDLQHLRRVIERVLAVARAKQAEARAAQELAASEQRLAQFAQHLQTTIENERAAIAREIHDDIGGALAAVKLDLAWITRNPASPQAQAHLQAANAMLQHAMGASQRIMMNLRPAILDQGLIAALEWLIEQFSQRTGMKTSLLVNHRHLQAAPPIALTAYRTAQEALTNISKYAHNSQVKIELSDAEGVLTLEISDNGPGISAQQLQKTDAFGIKGLKERAKVAGGWLDLSTQPGQGTTLILSIPLNQDGQATTSEHLFQ